MENLIKEKIEQFAKELIEECKGYPNKDNFIKGEAYWSIYKQIGKLCAECLGNAGSYSSDWYDHRLHFLDFEKNMFDFNMLSYDNAVVVLPLKGKVLDLCSGDGFYTWLLSRRASIIDAVEINKIQHDLSKRVWANKNINHFLGSVMDFKYPDNAYDMVFIRGAIEHFSEAHQIEISKNAYKTLKSGGWFVGDTPENKNAVNSKSLAAHECEFSSLEQLSDWLKKTFNNVNVYKLTSEIRTTLFWQAQKI